jgi:uncharacterized protein YjiS (DUF1127 family)
MGSCTAATYCASQQNTPYSCSKFRDENQGKKGIEMLTSFIRLVRRWRQHAEAVRELAALNDRELADMGITRSDILRVVRQHEED